MKLTSNSGLIVDLKLCNRTPESYFTRSNKYIAVFNNGTYEAESRTLRQSSPEDYKEIKHPNDIEPNYKKRDVKTFTGYVLGLVGDEQTANIVYQMIGRCFVGSYKDAQKYFMLYAKGDNGKSEFLDVLAQLVGENNTASNTLEQLTGNDSRFNRIDLLGRSLNFAGETSSARLLNAQLLKDVTGGDAIKVEEKGKQGYSARTECVLIFAMNELFQLSDFTHGMARRPVIIPFAKTFTDEEKAAFIRDDIRGKLKAETPAIIAFCIDSYMQARAEGRLFKESSDMLKIKDKWLYDSNYYAQYVEERCELSPELHSTKETLYNDFKNFAADDLGLKEPVTRKAFLRGMEELGYTNERGRINGQGNPVFRYWGIAPANKNTTRIEENK